MSHDDRDVAAMLERLYPPFIGGRGWDDVLLRLGQQQEPAAVAAGRRGPAGRSFRSLLAAALVGAALAATRRSRSARRFGS